MLCTKIINISEGVIVFHFQKGYNSVQRIRRIWVIYRKGEAWNMWHGRESVYRKQFDDEMGIFFTEEEFPELRDSRGDVSGVLTKAIQRLTDEQRYGILYIPEGEYRIRHTVLIPRAVRLIGYGESRPVFVLPAGTEGFEGQPDGTDALGCAAGQESPMEQENPMARYLEGYPGANYMFWFIGDSDLTAETVRDADAGTFYSALSNIDFRIEDGNPGAICIRAHFAQHGFISHCHFELGDGLAGIYDVGNEMEDLTFHGGDYGIVCRMCSPGWPFALLDSVFDGQKKAAVLSSMTGFTAFRLQIRNTRRAFDLYFPGTWEKLYLEDCIFENLSEEAITSWQSDNLVQQTNIRRLRCFHVPVLLRHADTGERITREEAAYEVEEYTCGYVMSDEREVPSHREVPSLKEIIRCREIAWPQEVSQGDIPPLAPMEQWVSVKKYGAVGDGKADDTEAVRAAVAAEKTVYFPQGIYRITDTVYLPEGVSLYGLHPATTQLVLTDDTPQFGGFGTPKPMLQTAQGGFACINGIGIDTAGKNPRAVGIKWMAGENSYMNDVKFMGGHGLMFRDGRNAFAFLYNPSRTGDYDPDRIWDYQYASLWIADGGGGVFKDIWSASPYAEAGIAITNTSAKGRMYAVSLEHHVRSEIKLHRVENWAFYALQTEEEKAEGMNCLPMELVSCRHITVANYYLFRVVAVDRSYDAGIRVWDCDDILFLNLENKAQMQFLFMLTLEDRNSGFYAKSPEYARLLITGGGERQPAPGACRVLAEGFDFAQGPAFDADGNLYWCDKAQKRIYRYDRRRGIVLPFLDIHFTPSALAVDTEGNLLVAADYSELKKTEPGEAFQTHDRKNFHPFFSWFYKRGEKAYAVSPDNPYGSMRELEKVQAGECHPEIVYRPAQMDYPGMFAMQAEQEIGAYYPAPDGKCALQGTVDLARSLYLAPAVEGERFLIADDAAHCVYSYRVLEGGNLHDGIRVASRGQYGTAVDAEGTVWVVEDRLYGYRDGVQVKALDVPADAHSVVTDGENFYLLGRSRVYLIERPGQCAHQADE